MKTEFNDKSGKVIYVGDIVQWQLGKFGKKSGGPSLFRVINTKKGPKIVVAHDSHDTGWLLRKNHEKFITIIDTKYREKD